MLREIKLFAKRFIPDHRSPHISVKWVRKDRRSWLAQYFKHNFISPKQTIFSRRIESLAKETDQLGPQPLWDGYANNNVAGPTRMPNGVRTIETIGNLFTYLVQKIQPNIVVEFGTAFGVSGMYFLAGIESNHKGKLLTFEPNDIWRGLAIRNLSQISDRFESIAGTFEDNIDDVLPRQQSIDLAFIDAIHTKEFVVPQLERVISQSSDHAVIILDDINFSDSMVECWEEVSQDCRFACSVALGGRVGILELNRSNTD